MLLSRRSSIKFTEDQANFIGHMCYAASKLWNVCNYERYHYKELGLEQYPDWYYQKKVHKNELWYNSFQPRPHRKSASSWIRRGSLSMP